MSITLRYFAAIFFTWLPLACFASCNCVFTAGPEVYHLSRHRDGGTHQKGYITALRVKLERIKGCSWYAGVDGLYGRGTLTGKTGTNRPLKSKLSDQIFEARLGFTFEQKITRCSYITLFGGWGCFKEINDFSAPSPIPCKFTDTFNYFTAGFLSGIYFTPLLSMGFNFKLKFSQNSQSRVSNDPLFDDVKLKMKDAMHIRVDVPLTYTPCKLFRQFGMQLAPFFEYRHFGGREGFPFNFRDTKFYLYGALLALTYQF